MERSFPLYLFGKIKIPCLKGGTLPLNHVRVGFYKVIATETMGNINRYITEVDVKIK